LKASWLETYGSAADELMIGEKADRVAAAGEVLVRLSTGG